MSRGSPSQGSPSQGSPSRGSPSPAPSARLRLKKLLVPVLVLVAVQAVLVGLYLLSAGRISTTAVPVERFRPPVPAPALEYRSHDGAAHHLSELRGRPVLVHVWATWCPPCRDELPGLLELAASGEITVLAVSVDTDWAPVREFLASVTGPRVPAAVVLAQSDAVTRALGVQTLPETFLVDARGRLRLRFAGARDWRSGAVRRLVAAETAPDRAQ